MRLNELKPNTEYATCDGHLVVTGDTVEGGYYSSYITKDGSEKFTITHGDPRKNGTVEGADPWAKCSTASDSRTIGNIRYVTKGGVKVKRYDFDRDGKRVEGRSVEMVVKPADIPGLWSEYVTLHADRIIGRFLMEDLQRQSNAARTMLGGIMRELHDKGFFPQRRVPHRFGGTRDAEAIEVGASPWVRLRTNVGTADWKPLSWAHDNGTRILEKRVVPSVTITGESNIDALLVALGQSPIFEGSHWMVYYQTTPIKASDRKRDKTFRIVTTDGEDPDTKAREIIKQQQAGGRFKIIDIVAVDISGRAIYPAKEEA